MSSRGAMLSSEPQPRICGFPPVVGNQTRVLILGSMPGVASLAAQQYYALRRNAFWPIMEKLFGAGFSLAYQDRLDLLTKNRIALWDVLGSCVRPGSLDASIDTRSAAANDFGQLFTDFPSIDQVFFNGRKAAEMYRRCVLPVLNSSAAAISVDTLPSTSPAHASLSFDDKLVAWSVVREATKRNQPGIILESTSQTD